MKVLITGATGLVGQNLVALFIKNGIGVNYLSTSRDKLKNEALYKGFFWDTNNGTIDHECFKDVDTIIHLAGASIAKRWTRAYKQEVLDSRVDTTNLLLRSLKERQHNVRNFISASAIGIYPDSLTKVYDESEQEIDDSFLGKVVREWEAAAHSFETLGIKVSVVRTGLVLANEGGALPQMAQPVKLGLGSALGSGKQMQSWIHIVDLVNIYYIIYKSSLHGTYNAVAPNPVTNEQLMQEIARILHKPYFMPNVPRFMLNAILGEMHLLLVSSQHVSADKIINAGYQFKYPLIQPALMDALK